MSPDFGLDQKIKIWRNQLWSSDANCSDVSSTFVSDAPYKMALSKIAPFKMALFKFTKDKLARVKFALDKSANCSDAPCKLLRMSVAQTNLL
jgi:hypothetical protein